MACCNCGVQYSPQWRSGPSGPRTLCNACGVRYAKGQPPFGAAPSAREPGMPAEPMEGQLSAEATAGDSSAAVVSAVRDPDHMPASCSPNLPELDIHFDSSDENETAARDSDRPATGVRQSNDAHEGTTAQPHAGLAHLQMGYAQGLTQPAFLAIPAESAWAISDQQPTADSGTALTPSQGQTGALVPVVRTLGLPGTLAARLMPSGMLQYSKVQPCHQADMPPHVVCLSEGSDGCFRLFQQSGIVRLCRSGHLHKKACNRAVALFREGWLRAWTELDQSPHLPQEWSDQT